MRKMTFPKMLVSDENKNAIHLLWQNGGCFTSTVIEDMTDPKKKDAQIIQRMCEHLQSVLCQYENEWVGIFLQGSQNYGLDTSESDVDTTVIVLPTLEDMIVNKTPISKTIHFDNGEHCEVKDIRLMFQIFRKQNINALEILATRWKIMNPAFEHEFSVLFDNVERIARYDNYRFVNDIYDRMMNERSLITKSMPARKDVVERFGYDGKCLCHMDHLYEFFCRFFIKEESFKDSLVSNKKDLLLAAKSQRYALDCAMITANTLIETMFVQKEEYKEDHSQFVDSWVDVLLDNTLEGIMLKHMERELQDRKEDDAE